MLVPWVGGRIKIGLRTGWGGFFWEGFGFGQFGVDCWVWNFFEGIFRGICEFWAGERAGFGFWEFFGRGGVYGKGYRIYIDGIS